MHRAVTAVAVALVAVAALGLLLATTTGRAADQFVSVSNFQFSPANTTIDVGDSVTFSFDGGSHGVQWTGGPAATPSGVLSSGTFVFTPTQAGMYTYICAVHPSMSGSVMVNAQQQEPTATNTSPAPTATNTTAPPTATPTNTATTAAPTNTSVPTNTTAPAATATPPPRATTAAGAGPTDTPTPAGEDDTATRTPAGSATDTPTPASESTAAPTPEVPDTAEEGNGDGPPWGLIIVLAVIAVAVIGGGAAVLGLRGRA